MIVFFSVVAVWITVYRGRRFTTRPYRHMYITAFNGVGGDAYILHLAFPNEATARSWRREVLYLNNVRGNICALKGVRSEENNKTAAVAWLGMCENFRCRWGDQAVPADIRCAVHDYQASFDIVQTEFGPDLGTKFRDFNPNNTNNIVFVSHVAE